MAKKKRASSKKSASAPEKVERLPPTPSVVKKLFAYSGNQCAIPTCSEPLVDPSGTMLGKIAHICAAESGGARFDPNMSNESRRSFDNLMVVCGRHHDVIDDPANTPAYPVQKLRQFKTDHEGRFKKAERQLLASVVDVTQATQPTYPKTLKALAKALENDEIAGHPDEIDGVREFIQKLKELPLAERDFARKVAERMRRQQRDILPVTDVAGALQIDQKELKQHMDLLNHHRLGRIEDGDEPGQHVVSLQHRQPGGNNPWFEILDFCEATDQSPDRLIHDLNFGLYDG
jgi:hypothetical protein